MEALPVYAVEDDARALRSLQKLVSTRPELVLVGAAVSGESALLELEDRFGAAGAQRKVPKAGRAAEVQPRVVLMDIELPGQSGIETTAAIRARGYPVEVLALTSYDDEEHVFQAMRAGASGYVVKGASGDKLSRAILDVDAGGTVIEPRLARRFWDFFRGVQAPPQPQGLLTELERDLLFAFAKGLSNAEVGSVTRLDVRTVRTHLGHIYRKLGVRSHVEAVVEALRRGLIQL